MEQGHNFSVLWIIFTLKWVYVERSLIVVLLDCVKLPATTWSWTNWSRKTSRSSQRKCCCSWTEAVKETIFGSVLTLSFINILHASSFFFTFFMSFPAPRRPRVHVQTHSACTALGAQVPAGCFRQPRDCRHLLPHRHDGDDRHRRSTDIWPFTWWQGGTLKAADVIKLLIRKWALVGHCGSGKRERGDSVVCLFGLRDSKAKRLSQTVKQKEEIIFHGCIASIFVRHMIIFSPCPSLWSCGWSISPSCTP